MNCFKTFLKILLATSAGVTAAGVFAFGAGWVCYRIEETYGLIPMFISLFAISAIATAAIVTPFYCRDYE